jgi:hypothetical protein
MAAARRVESEWLDQLPADDPRAARSRRDLRRVNLWMGNAGIMRRLIAAHAPDRPRTWLEIGAGDGTFALRLARRLAPSMPCVALTLVDRQDVVTRETRGALTALGWTLDVRTADIFDVLSVTQGPRADIITANLFLHHFRPPQLARLLAGVATRAKLFVACEPRRSALALAGSRMLWAIGCNDVSRHDAVVSVRAGFSGVELSSLWPERAGFQLTENAAGLFTHCFVARRAEAQA